MATGKNSNNNRTVIQSLSLVLQFGINMLVPTLGMGALGYFIDTKCGTKWVCIVLFFVGALAGFNNVYRLAMKIAKAPKEEPDVTVLNRRKDADKADDTEGEDSK